MPILVEHFLRPGEVESTEATASTGVTWREASETLEASPPGFDRTSTQPTRDGRTESGPLTFTPTSESALAPHAARPTGPNLVAPSAASNSLAPRLLALVLVVTGGLLVGLWLPSLWSRRAEPPPGPARTPSLAPPYRVEASAPEPELELEQNTRFDELEDDLGPGTESEVPVAEASTARRRVRRAERRIAATPSKVSAPSGQAEEDVEADQLKSALGRLARELRQARPSLEPEALRAFESRYFDLRAEYRSGLEPAVASSLEARVRAELEPLELARQAGSE